LVVSLGSHFPVKAANLWIGRFLAGLLGINYGGWYKEHDMQHHNLLGRSEHMLANDASATIFITRKTWEAAPTWRRTVWRVLRGPLLFYTILPPVVFLCGVQNPGKFPG
jgi:fatty acid desaturase